jgi:dTDP-glucose 4,6-dehydratase
VIVNYSAQGEVRHSWNWPEQWFYTNCLGVVRITEHLKKKSYLKRYVAISTPEVYGVTGDEIKENHHYCPSTPYAVSKLAGDLHLFSLYKRYDFPVVFTRSANVYGIHQQLFRIIPRTIIHLKLNKKIDLHGRGYAKRSFVHVRDVADLTYRAIVYGKSGEVYHVSSDESLLSISDIVSYICTLMGRDFVSSVNYMDENYGQDLQYSLDASKAKNELGWRQKIRFEDGVRETIEWIEDNWNFIKEQPVEYVHKK